MIESPRIADGLAVVTFQSYLRPAEGSLPETRTLA